jgi:sulfatase modifying factor 1
MKSDTRPSEVLIPAGTFTMGSNRFYPEERPVHEVSVAAFSIDATTVTNAQFARFVEATGYVTVAERPLNPTDYPGALPEMLFPGALVFRPTRGPVDLRNWAQWWDYVKGACWRRPDGVATALGDLDDHPVVQIAYEDATAYASWMGKRLPTEAEWEYAARGGLHGKPFVWGDEMEPGGVPPANWWQGEFPWQNLATDGFVGSAPVGSFPPNGYGLFDMAGNVWEWTSDWFASAHAPQKSGCCSDVDPREAMRQSFDPAQPEIHIPRKVLKGGSFLCAPNYCLRFRPAARSPQMIDTGMAHLGFRCVRDVET